MHSRCSVKKYGDLPSLASGFARVVVPALGGLLVLLFLLAKVFDANTWAFNNDHLIPLSQINFSAASGMSLKNVIFARIPSLFPDYLIALVATGATADQVGQYVLSWVMQLLGLLICLDALVYFAAKRYDSKMPFLYPWLANCFICFLVSTQPPVANIVFYSCLPVYHGGNTINIFLALFAVFLLYSEGHCIASAIRSGLKVLILGLCVLASFSNRLFLFQFAIPLVFSGLVESCSSHSSLLLASILRNRRDLRFIFQILAASATGIVLYYISYRQCTDVSASGSFHVFWSQLAELNTSGLLVGYLVIYNQLCF